MSTSVVITQAAFSNDEQSLDVKGTVATVAFQATLFNTLDTLPQQVKSGNASAIAAEFLSRYNNYTAAVALLASVNFSYQPELNAGPTVAIAYGSTPVALAGYTVLEVTATVNTVSTIAHITQEDFLEYASAGNLLNEMAALLVNQNVLNTQISAGIATFSL